MKILVCGGAGYIGSHAVAELLERGCEVAVADNLERGHRAAVDKAARLYDGDLRDEAFLDGIFAREKIDAVMDFAALHLVGESVSAPLTYYDNNFLGTLGLLQAMKRAEVGNLIFSSTAAVYGVPEKLPITEDSRTSPINPYGETKLAIEKALKWTDAAHGIKSAALRYFNVAGAHESGKIGEEHRPETHIIPNILKALLSGSTFRLFGDDYNTRDGSCVRDYIHVSDLVGAHILALEKLLKDNESFVYNLGSENGYSNLEIIRAAEKITGKKLDYTVEGRRPGDPDTLIASSDKIRAELGWRPERGLEDIIESAYRWHRDHPEGYRN